MCERRENTSEGVLSSGWDSMVIRVLPDVYDSGFIQRGY
jgi:hypothetical protein